MMNIELDESDSQHSDMDWEEEHFCEFNHEDDTDSSICSMEETDSKLESLSESSHDISEMWLDDIFSSHYSDILVEEARLQDAKKENSTSFEAQPHCTNSVLEGTSESIEFVTKETDYLSNGISSEHDQSTLTEEVFQYPTNAEDNNRENEKHVDYEASFVSMVLDEETVENSEVHKTSESCEIDESCEDRNASLENSDDGISQENQIHSSEVPEESTIIVQEQKLLEENQVRGSKLQSTGGEEQHTSKNWQWGTKRKRLVEEDEEMRKINPRKPNFLPFAAEPKPEKVELKHQMIDERKNAEEWMLDFTLRQTVMRLAPAGKRKVALLVEAFETVMSMPICETHMRNDSPFAHARPIQACS
ncbi:calmodulin binding [Spatholobus suberectus]|nr:calmodulin binding [Spatholobus suberectus]